MPLDDSPTSAGDVVTIDGLGRVIGLTIHDTSDVDYFSVSLHERAAGDDVIRLQYEGIANQVRLELRDANDLLLRTADSVSQNLSFAGYGAGNYFLKVFSDPVDGGTGRYSLLPSFGDDAQATVDFSGPERGQVDLDGLTAGDPTIQPSTCCKFDRRIKYQPSMI